MSIRLWWCKVLTKRIWKWEYKEDRFRVMLSKIKQWKKQDKRLLDKNLKKLSDEENLLYGLQNGFIDKEEYKTIKRS